MGKEQIVNEPKTGFVLRKMPRNEINFVIRIFLFFEIFFFNGLLFFWIIYKCDRILIESLYDLVAYLGSGLVVFIFAALLFNKNQKFNILKNRIISMQGTLNFITAALGLLLLAILQYSAWLYYPIPLGWTFNLYFLFNGFEISCAMVFESGNKSILHSLKQKKMKVILAGVLIILSILSYWLVFYSKYLSPLIIYIICLHSFLGLKLSLENRENFEKKTLNDEKSKDPKNLLIQNSYTDILILDLEGDPKTKSKLHHSAVWSASLFIFLSLFYRAFLEKDPRAFEASWELLMNFFFGIGTLIGAITCITLVFLSLKEGRSLIIYGIGILSLLSLSSVFNIFILAPVFFGFGFFLNLFLQLSGDARGYSFYAWSNQLVWTLGLIATNFYGVLRDYTPIFTNVLVFLILLFSGLIFYLFYLLKIKNKNAENKKTKQKAGGIKQ